MELERPTSKIERPTSNEGIKQSYQLKQISFSIKLAALTASGWAENRTCHAPSNLPYP
jgi:hypothetical protein